MTDKEIIDLFKTIAAFLSETLDKNIEIAVHDMTDLDQSLVAIYNNQISGREIGAPPTDFAFTVMNQKLYKDKPYLTNYSGKAKGSASLLRSSTFFIKNKAGALIGLLCLNIDNSKYIQLMELFKTMAYPNYTDFDLEESSNQNAFEIFPASAKEMVFIAIGEVCGTESIPPERLTTKEKISIVKCLYDKGFFMLKGGIMEVSAELKLSEATIYRYISKIKRDGEPEKE